MKKVKNKNTHFSYEERVKIETFLKEEYGIRKIARKLHRAKSSVSSEVCRNSVNGIYTARKANIKTYQRYWRARHQHFKIAMNKALRFFVRSEEHTSELQSQSNLVCRLLLEKKKNPKVLSDVPCLIRTGDLPQSTLFSS